jgi:hypothetical protein
MEKENKYFEREDVKIGEYEYIDITIPMMKKYEGKINVEVTSFYFIQKDGNCYIEAVFDNFLGLEQVRDLYNLNFIIDSDESNLFHTFDSTQQNANKFLNLDDYTTVLAIGNVFIQDAIDSIINAKG